jgi:hypothetical protein
MEFRIGKKSTFPVLKLQVVNDGRQPINDMMTLIESASIFFSMVDSKTGVPKIQLKPASFVSKTFEDPNASPEYYLYYQFTEKDTSKSGIFQGEFTLRTQDGVLVVPIREQLLINVDESLTTIDEFFPSQTPSPTYTRTPTPTVTTTPTNTPTNTSTPTPSVTPSPTR